jgi:hypothetical protein
LLKATVMKKLLLLACVLSAGCTINNNTTADGGGVDDSGTTPVTDSGSSETTPDPDTGTGPVTDSGSMPGDTSVPPGKTANSCSTGSVWAGNPKYDGSYLDRPASGTGILADPPFQWENLVFNNGWLFSRDTGELWGVDLSAASKVEKLVAGKNRSDANYGYSAGPCATARFSRIEGLAALPDKSLVVADSLGNGVLHVKDPSGAGCTVEYWAGNATANLDYDPYKYPPNEGDVDGPGASTKLDTPTGIVADEAGNVYFFDSGNHKIKKIANDAAHTVTTLVKLPTTGAPDRIPNLTRIGSKIYGVGTDPSKSYVFSVDTATGTMTTLLSGTATAFPPMDSYKQPVIHGITTDGTGLIISGNGYVWYLTTTGTLKHIAGMGPNIDYWASGYDPKASHPAMDLWLPGSRAVTSIGSADYIAYYDGALYYRGHANGTAAFIEKISCP